MLPGSAEPLMSSPLRLKARWFRHLWPSSVFFLVSCVFHRKFWPQGHRIPHVSFRSSCLLVLLTFPLQTTVLKVLVFVLFLCACALSFVVQSLSVCGHCVSFVLTKTYFINNRLETCSKCVFIDLIKFYL